MVDEKEKEDTMSYGLSKEETIVLGKDEAAIVCRGDSIVLYFPNRPDDEPVGTNDLLCMALAGVMAHQPDVLMAELDRINAMEDDENPLPVEPPFNTLSCPNCNSDETYRDAVDEDGNEGWICCECHEGWDVDDEGVMIRQDTKQE